MLAMVAALALGAAAAQAASAKTKPPGNVPAISQYVEQVPSAGGPEASALTKPGSRPLAPKARQKLARLPRSVASRLEKVATSSRYGAPHPAPQGVARDALGTTKHQTGEVAAAVGAARAAVGNNDGQLVALLVILVVTTAGGVGLALYRHARG